MKKILDVVKEIILLTGVAILNATVLVLGVLVGGASGAFVGVLLAIVLIAIEVRYIMPRKDENA